MNKTEISREKIIETAAGMLGRYNASDFSMREIAAACHVAVGSIYNYFPAKADLVTAVVEHIWAQVFREGLPEVSGEISFSEIVSILYCKVYAVQKGYQNFFLRHRTLIGTGGREQGRSTMTHYIQQMKEMLTHYMEADQGIREEVWTEDFTEAQMIDFIFEHFLSGLARGDENCNFLIQVLALVLYQK